MIYYSKKDTWLVAFVAAAIAIPLIIGLYNLLTTGGNSRAGWSSILIGVSTWAVVLWLTYPLYYEITPTVLKIRCGMLINQQILLTEIEEVRATKNPLSAPAWSLDRLRVSYRRDGSEQAVLISPLDKAGFLQELAEISRGLELRGGRVVRVQ